MTQSQAPGIPTILRHIEPPGRTVSRAQEEGGGAAAISGDSWTFFEKMLAVYVGYGASKPS
jgi:hypothetical protein